MTSNRTIFLSSAEVGSKPDDWSIRIFGFYNDYLLDLFIYYIHIDVTTVSRGGGGDLNDLPIIQL